MPTGSGSKTPKERTVQCPECETDVKIVRDDDGDDNGRCANCGLDVGRVLTRYRLDRAISKVREGEEEEGRLGLEEEVIIERR